MRVEVFGLRELRRDLRRLAPEIDKELRSELREAARLIQGLARSNASWSRRIPGAIRTEVVQKGAAVRLSAAKAAHGPLYEGPKSFRHPLFGDRQHWYVQRARPFLRPAADAKLGEAHKKAVDAIERAKRKVNL